MLTSFYTAISGLNANAMALNVVGNNLANVNTVGFKSDIISFQDVISATLSGVNYSGNPIQIGLGTQVAGVSPNFNQGSLKSTSQPSDLAITGNGFFVVRKGNGQVFTRAGNFTFNSNGQLVTQQGFVVQGWTAVNGAIPANAVLGDINIGPGMSLAPRATNRAQINVNLNAEATAGATSAYNTTVQVYDSLGVAHAVTWTFTKTGPGAWTYSIACPDGAFTPTNPAAGTLTFDSTGTLTQVNGVAPANVTLTLGGLPNGAANLVFDWAVLDTNNVPILTQYAATSATSQTTINGFPSGNLTTFAVDTSGNIQGIFSNGQVTLLGQIALASFTNPQGLVKDGQNSFSKSLTSGEPSIGAPNSGGRGTLIGSSLEFSNVDIANEFTTLIISQRGYQASSRVITTSDEILQEAIALKR